MKVLPLLRCRNGVKGVAELYKKTSVSFVYQHTALHLGARKL